MAGCAGTLLLAGCSAGEPAPTKSPQLPGDRDGQAVPRKPVTVGDSECEVVWRHGKARTPAATSSELWATVLLRDCDRAKVLAERVMKVLDSTPPARAPQRPMLYRPDEPDTARAN